MLNARIILPRVLDHKKKTKALVIILDAFWKDHIVGGSVTRLYFTSCISRTYISNKELCKRYLHQVIFNELALYLRNESNIALDLAQFSHKIETQKTYFVETCVRNSLYFVPLNCILRAKNKVCRSNNPPIIIAIFMHKKT